MTKQESHTPITSRQFLKIAKNDIKMQKMEFLKAAFNIAVFKIRRLILQKHGSLNFDAELAESGTANFLAFYKEVLDSVKKN